MTVMILWYMRQVINRDIRLYSPVDGKKLHVQRRAHTRSMQCTIRSSP